MDRELSFESSHSVDCEIYSTPLGELKNKPSSAKFKQQRLPAWQPIFTADTVLPFFAILGIAFVPIGAFLLHTSQNVQELQFDYTDCTSRDQNITCLQKLRFLPSDMCTCNVYFNLTEEYRKTVYFYYGLSNYYQNHRRYVKSRDDYQLSHGYLKGDLEMSDCKPFDMAYDSKKHKEMPVAPCGAIANSLFNDTFKLYYITESDIRVNMSEENIAWPTDIHYKFKNPKDLDDWGLVTHPPNWKKYAYEMQNGLQNEHLIVWMRTAALPTFRKLWAVIDHKHPFKSGLPKGNYRVEINYAYIVSDFDGRKRFIISNTSWMGGKNAFLGISYIVTGVICIAITVVFFIINKKYRKSDSEMIRLTINTPYSPHK